MFWYKMPPSSNILLALCVILVLNTAGAFDEQKQNSTEAGPEDVGDHPAPGPAGSPRLGAFPALIAFGDSILDTGNNNLRLTFTKCNFPPYGRDFPLRVPTGRFGNGKVFSDLLGEALGIKSTLPAFHSPLLRNDELATGVCFASSGSGLDPLTSRIQNVITIMEQFNDFKFQYIRRLEGAVGAEKAKSIISSSLYLVSSGNNDVAISYASILRWFLIGPTFYTTTLVMRASTFIKEMHALGARNFAVMSTLPLGCLPADRTFEGGPLRICSFLTNMYAQMFNSKLEAEMKNLNTILPGAKIVFLDVYNPLLDVIRNPIKYGFLRAKTACCGTGFLEFGPFCNIFNPFTCWDASTRVFWDAAHPSEKAYKIVVSQVKDQIRSTFNLP